MSKLLLTHPDYALDASERQELSLSVQQMVEHYRNQPQTLNLMMLEAVSVVQTVSVRSTSALEQNWLWRQWHRFTGKDVRRNTEDLHDLARGLHLTQEFLACLQKQQLFTAEALVVMDSKVTQLLRDVTGLQQNQNRQQQQINQIYEGVMALNDALDDQQRQIVALYQGLRDFCKRAEEQFSDHEQRISRLEWIDLLKSPKPVWQGRSYRELSLREKLACLANDFCRETKAQPSLNDWYGLYVRLQDIGLDPEHTAPARILYEADADDLLWTRWLKDMVAPEALPQLAAPSTPLALGFVLLRGYRGKNRHQIEVIQEQLRDNGVDKPLAELELQTLMRHIRQHCGREFNQPIPLHELLGNLAAELLHLRLIATVENRPALARIALPAVENIHGWSANKVQALQKQTAAALGKPVAFRDALKAGGEGPEMLVIPAGRFLMGSPNDELARSDDEMQHEVTFAQPYAIGRHAVTFDDYDRYCQATGKTKLGDQGWGRGRRPVINVSWRDAQAYCAWLSEQTGQRYRLPSEAEWEYACRAGTATPFHWGDRINPQQANYVYNGGAKGECRQKTVPVGQFTANAFGLYDCHGNVWEWCEDHWHGSYQGAPGDGSAWIESNNNASSARVVRGGSWNNDPNWLRSAYRNYFVATLCSLNLGFRLAQDLSL